MISDLVDRTNQIDAKIHTLKNKVVYRDLVKMLKTVTTALTQADIESVECRRLKKITPKFTDLRQKAEDLLDNLEQHVTLAILMS